MWYTKTLFKAAFKFIQTAYSLNWDSLNIESSLLQQTTSELWCLSGSKRGDYQNCSVLYWVLKLCTVISTLRWAVLTVLWIVLSQWATFTVHWFISVYLCVFFILHGGTVGWTWRKRSLILRTYLPSALWHCWLDHLTHKNPYQCDL